GTNAELGELYPRIRPTRAGPRRARPKPSPPPPKRSSEGPKATPGRPKRTPGRPGGSWVSGNPLPSIRSRLRNDRELRWENGISLRKVRSALRIVGRALPGTRGASGNPGTRPRPAVEISG